LLIAGGARSDVVVSSHSIQQTLSAFMSISLPLSYSSIAAPSPFHPKDMPGHLHLCVCGGLAADCSRHHCKSHQLTLAREGRAAQHGGGCKLMKMGTFVDGLLET